MPPYVMPTTALMKTLYRVLYPDGRANNGVTDWPDHAPPSWTMIDALVRPFVQGSPEHILVTIAGETVSMYVVDLAHLRLHHQMHADLLFNAQATAIYRQHWMTRYPRTDPNTLPMINGNAVVFDRIVR